MGGVDVDAWHLLLPSHGGIVSPNLQKQQRRKSKRQPTYGLNASTWIPASRIEHSTSRATSAACVQHNLSLALEKKNCMRYGHLLSAHTEGFPPPLEFIQHRALHEQRKQNNGCQKTIGVGRVPDTRIPGRVNAEDKKSSQLVACAMARNLTSHGKTKPAPRDALQKGPGSFSQPTLVENVSLKKMVMTLLFAPQR